MADIGDDRDQTNEIIRHHDLDADVNATRSDIRDRRADERDRAAGERDKRADRRDALADDRGLLADDRERLLDERQQELADQAERDHFDTLANADQSRRLRAIREGMDRRLTVVELQEWLLEQPPEEADPDISPIR